MRLNEERHQPHEGDEAPALRFHTYNQPLQSRAGPAPHPVCRKVASDKEGRGRAERCADEVKGCPPERTEERTAGKAEERTGHEEQRREGEERDMGEWRPRPEIPHRGLKQRWIEAIPIDEKPERRACYDKPEQNARGDGARCHSTGSRRPSG